MNKVTQKDNEKINLAVQPRKFTFSTKDSEVDSFVSGELGEVKEVQVRSAKFVSKKRVYDQINRYFTDKYRQQRPVTFTGLANALGLCRNTLKRYSKINNSKDPVALMIKKAVNMIEESLEEKLLLSTQGVIYGLKENYSWSAETPTTQIQVNNTQASKQDKDQIKEILKANKLM